MKCAAMSSIANQEWSLKYNKFWTDVIFMVCVMGLIGLRIFKHQKSLILKLGN